MNFSTLLWPSVDDDVSQATEYSVRSSIHSQLLNRVTLELHNMDTDGEID